ncbi:uncharacterized protein BDR25DRAFT_353354 [Lindgomyces ingoldianus]|uniref:Uncharacterized protein n=1 Tax=Lindgomyces ingoldianus TaxID=673940 RepID=A0ACB6R1E4_9PLEO|nr:uncharacterized protein BDR25DRAFT_353354 [Lindgomyces ingoldianus]KAF2472332.1 hypothetical protein BDR25DRAFT_353354 [Lindgomyces ingoldianus]
MYRQSKKLQLEKQQIKTYRVCSSTLVSGTVFGFKGFQLWLYNVVYLVNSRQQRELLGCKSDICKRMCTDKEGCNSPPQNLVPSPFSLPLLTIDPNPYAPQHTEIPTFQSSPSHPPSNGNLNLDRLFWWWKDCGFCPYAAAASRSGYERSRTSRTMYLCHMMLISPFSSVRRKDKSNRTRKHVALTLPTLYAVHTLAVGAHSTCLAKWVHNPGVTIISIRGSEEGMKVHSQMTLTWNGFGINCQVRSEYFSSLSGASVEESLPYVSPWVPRNLLKWQVYPVTISWCKHLQLMQELLGSVGFIAGAALLIQYQRSQPYVLRLVDTSHYRP